MRICNRTVPLAIPILPSAHILSELMNTIINIAKSWSRHFLASPYFDLLHVTCDGYGYLLCKLLDRNKLLIHAR